MAKGPITRDAFLYLAPKAPKDSFAQCGTCLQFVEGDNRCIILGPAVRVTAQMSCGFYLHGDPKPKGAKSEKIVTREEAGLVDREVRCENCAYFAKTCGLYEKLNAKLPGYFDLDAKVDAKGCCNAQEPKAQRKARDRSVLYDRTRR